MLHWVQELKLVVLSWDLVHLWTTAVIWPSEVGGFPIMNSMRSLFSTGAYRCGLLLTGTAMDSDLVNLSDW